MKREGLFKRPPISRELRRKIEAEREWIEKLTAEKRRIFRALMGRDVGLAGGEEDALRASARAITDDPYARFVPVAALIDIDAIADEVSEDVAPVRGGAK